MCYLIGLQNVLDYNEVKHRITPRNGNLIEFITGSLQNPDVKANASIGGNAFQLGWDSFIALRRVNGGLEIERIECKNRDGWVDVTGDSRNQSFGSVVTRAVDTCTFIYISNGDMRYMFHLDEYDDTRADFLVNKLREIGGGNGFVSLVKFNEEYIRCFAGTGIIFQQLIREVKNFDTFPEDQKEPLKDCPEQVNFYGHIEIGLRVQNGEVLLFGDVTNCYRGDAGYMNGAKAPCYRFDSIGEQVNDAARALVNDMP